MHEKVAKIMGDNIVLDSLFHDMFDDPPLTATADKTLVDLLLEGGVNVVSDTVKADTYGIETFMDLCRRLYTYYLCEDTFPEKVKIIYTVDDMRTAKREGKLGIILSTQGADVLEQDIRLISLAYKLGLRIVQITYNQDGHIGSGTFEPNDKGLTRFGQQAIFEMNRVGMIIDLSHVGNNTAMDAIELSADPVIYSHSNALALCKNKRNAPDEHIKKLAAKGGVIGVCPHSVFCTDDKSKVPTVDTFIDHMDYICDLVGSADHLGIGTDRFVQPTMSHKMTRREFARTLPGFFGPYDISNKQVEGFNKFEQWPNLVDRMLARGYSEDAVGKILGGNFIRVFEQVWGKDSR